MKCINCGKDIPDDAQKCEFCGEEYYAPVKLGSESINKALELEKTKRREYEEELRKKKNKERMEKLRKSGAFYERTSAYVISITASVLASLLIMCAPFLNWISIVLREPKDTKRMGFKLVDVAKNVSKGYYVVIALIILLGLMMLYFTIVDHNNIWESKFAFTLPEPALFKKYRVYSRIAPVVFAIILAIVFTHLNSYNVAYESSYHEYHLFQSSIETARDYLHYDPDMSASFGRGPGFYEYVFSVIIYLLSRAYKFVIDTLNEED